MYGPPLDILATCLASILSQGCLWTWHTGHFFHFLTINKCSNKQNTHLLAIINSRGTQLFTHPTHPQKANEHSNSKQSYLQTTAIINWNRHRRDVNMKGLDSINAIQLIWNCFVLLFQADDYVHFFIHYKSHDDLNASPVLMLNSNSGRKVTLSCSSTKWNLRLFWHQTSASRKSGGCDLTPCSVQMTPARLDQVLNECLVCCSRCSCLSFSIKCSYSSSVWIFFSWCCAYITSCSAVVSMYTCMCMQVGGVC